MQQISFKTRDFLNNDSRWELTQFSIGRKISLFLGLQWSNVRSTNVFQSPKNIPTPRHSIFYVYTLINLLFRDRIFLSPRRLSPINDRGKSLRWLTTGNEQELPSLYSGEFLFLYLVKMHSLLDIFIPSVIDNNVKWPDEKVDWNTPYMVIYRSKSIGLFNFIKLVTNIC